MSVDKKVRNLYYEKLYRMRGELPVGFKSKVHVYIMKLKSNSQLFKINY